MDFKVNDVVQFTEKAITECVRLFGDKAVLKDVGGKKYKVLQVYENENEEQIVRLGHIDGTKDDVFFYGVYGGHLERVSKGE